MEELWLCKNWQYQFITKAQLIEKVFLKLEFDGYIHHWPINPKDHNDHWRDEVKTLLDDVMSKEKIVNKHHTIMETILMVVKLKEQSKVSKIEYSICSNKI